MPFRISASLLISQSLGVLATLASVACSDLSRAPGSSSASASIAKPAAPGGSATPAPPGSAALASSSAALAASAPPPPPRGIFPSGGADAILARGAAPKIEVFETGSDPKAKLVLAHPEKPPARAVSLAIEVPPAKEPPAVFELAFKADPEAKAVANDDRAYLATIERIHGPGGAPFPPQLAAALADAKNRTYRFELGPHGRVSSFALGGREPKDAMIGHAMDLVAETLSIIVPPLPDVPMGVGGRWMVTERTTSGDYDAIRYAVYRVHSMHEDGRITIVADVQGYAASSNPNQYGLVSDIYFGDYRSEGNGGFNFVPDAILPDGFASVMTAVTLRNKAHPSAAGVGNIENVSMEVHATTDAH